MELSKQRQYADIAFLFLVTLALSYFISPIFKTPQTDKQVFVYGSMTILKGGVPYKDFFDHKPPLIYLILALGWPFKWWGVWFVGIIAKWIAVFYLYKAAIKYTIHLRLLIPLTFLVTLLDPFIICLGSFTREYSAVFIAIALSIILLNQGKKYILSGLLVGLTFFTQQEEILALLPFIIWHLFTQEDQVTEFNWKLIPKRIFQMSIGFLMVLIPLAIWLYSNEALIAFWEQAFMYNFFIYRPNNPMSDRLLNSFRLFYHSRIGFFIIGFLILHCYFYLRRSNRVLHLTALIALLLFAVLKSTSSRLGEMYHMQHYFLGYSALFAISTLLILREWKLYLGQLKGKLIVVSLFLFSSWFLWENALNSKFIEKENVYNKRMTEIMSYVKEVKNKDGKLFVFRNTSYVKLYNELNCLSPSKWIYTTTYNSKLKFDKTENVVRDIINSLELNQTIYIVDLSVEWPLLSSTMRSEWNRYLFANYSVIKSTDGYTLLKRNNRLEK